MDSRESRKGKGRERDMDQPQPAREKENRRFQPTSSMRAEPPPPPPTKEAQIVALTHSGGWFRISLGAEAAPGAPPSPSFGLGKDSTNDCRLEEHHRFGSSDGW